MGQNRVTTVRPSVLVGTLNALPIAVVSGVLGAVPAAPLVDRVAPATLLVGSTYASTALGLVVLGVVLAAGRALLGRRTVAYHIDENRIEVVSRGLRERRTVLPRAKVRHVGLSAGVLAGHVGGGTVEVAVRGPHTRVDLQLRAIADADEWYERLRTVEGTEPRKTVSRAIAPELCRMGVYVLLFVGVAGTLTTFVALYALPTLSPSLVLLVGLLVATAVLSAYHIYVASIQYRIYNDHIERRRRFLGTERGYVSAADISGVEHVRELSERVFDVGTVSLTANWRDEPFDIRAVEESEALLERFQRIL